MEIASEKDIFPAFAPMAQEPSLAASEARRTTYLLLSIVGMALFLRLYGISLYPLAGDEYNSIAGARDINLNWNSISYAVLTHYWIRWGNSELWLRLPAVIFGTISVVVLFKIGKRLVGTRTGVVAATLAATSPFNIYHSQEMRFYSLFMLASATFLLATIQYLDNKQTVTVAATTVLAGLFLLSSHFLGVLALCTQSVATVLAKKWKWARWKRILVLSGLVVLMVVPLIRGIQQQLWSFYSAHAGVTDFSLPSITPISSVNFGKVALAGYTFLFGYYVYPLRLVLVIFGLCVCGVLLGGGAVKLWQSQWRLLPIIYLLSVIAVFFVLNSIGGRVSSVLGPRHVAFVWPAFILLLALGVASFQKVLSGVLLASLLTVNCLSIFLGWRQDWRYGPTEDYRAAAAYASRWNATGTAMLVDGRSQDPIRFYFAKNLQQIDSLPYLSGKDLADLYRYERLIMITNDWDRERRGGFDNLLAGLQQSFALVDGRVDYPLFQYVLERKKTALAAEYSVRSDANQINQPLSFYGLEFQDLRLPVAVKVEDVPLSVIGMQALPTAGGGRELTLPLNQPITTRRLILLTNVIGADKLNSGQQVATITVEDVSRNTHQFPLRLGNETASWADQCEPAALCDTVFQWHKRIAIVGQSRYDGAFRDFSAGLHGTVFELPQTREVTKVTVNYVANSGQVCIWGMALPVDRKNKSNH